MHLDLYAVTQAFLTVVLCVYLPGACSGAGLKLELLSQFSASAILVTGTVFLWLIELGRVVSPDFRGIWRLLMNRVWFVRTATRFVSADALSPDFVLLFARIDIGVWDLNWRAALYNQIFGSMLRRNELEGLDSLIPPVICAHGR